MLWTKSPTSPSPRAPLHLNEQACIHVPPFRLHFLMVSNTLFETQEVQPIGLLFITSVQQQDQDRGHRFCPATKSASWSSKWAGQDGEGGWESIHYLNSALALLWAAHCLNGSDQPTITDHNAFSASSTSLEVCLRSPAPLHISKAEASMHHGYEWNKTATPSADIKHFRQKLWQWQTMHLSPSHGFYEICLQDNPWVMGIFPLLTISLHFNLYFNMINIALGW